MPKKKKKKKPFDIEDKRAELLESFSMLMTIANAQLRAIKAGEAQMSASLLREITVALRTASAFLEQAERDDRYSGDRDGEDGMTEEERRILKEFHDLDPFEPEPRSPQEEKIDYDPLRDRTKYRHTE